MNKNMMIVLGGGFFIALLVALLVQAALAPSNDSVEKAPTISILVAKEALETGDEASAANMKWQEWPEDALFSGAIKRESDEQKIEDVVAGRLRRPMAEGEPVLKSALVEGDGNILSARLDAGKRAVGIKVKAETVAGGFIGPGDVVDVILTYEIRVPQNNVSMELMGTISRYASETILENIEVLAMDQNSKRSTKEDAKVGRTVTLEVSGQEAEILNLAERMGDLSLALRGLGDETSRYGAEGANDPITTDVVAAKVLRRVRGMQASGEGASQGVRVYSGNSFEDISVRQHQNAQEIFE